MAIPASRNSSYVASTTPTIKAKDLNDLQDYTVHVFQATKTLKALEVDGTGDNATAVPAGSIRASRSVNSTTVPTPGADLLAGEMTKHSVPAGMAFVRNDGMGINSGHGIHSAGYGAGGPGSGEYQVVFRRVPTGPSTLNCVMTVTPLGLAAAYYKVNLTLDGSNRIVADVKFSSAVDRDFWIVAWIF